MVKYFQAPYILVTTYLYKEDFQHQNKEIYEDMGSPWRVPNDKAKYLVECPLFMLQLSCLLSIIFTHLMKLLRTSIFSKHMKGMCDQLSQSLFQYQLLPYTLVNYAYSCTLTDQQ